jgi:hypothetical protein
MAAEISGRESARQEPEIRPARSYHVMKPQDIDDPQRSEIEAAVFRRLLEHLDEHKEVQNIDLMNLAGFCRNCLSKWYVAACQDAGIDMDYEAARERVYGMPYADWKARHQSEASAGQLDRFESSQSSRQ